MTVSWNQGWFYIRVTNRCPTMPVPPITPTLYFSIFNYLQLVFIAQKHAVLGGGQGPAPEREPALFDYMT